MDLEYPLSIELYPPRNSTHTMTIFVWYNSDLGYSGLDIAGDLHIGIREKAAIENAVAATKLDSKSESRWARMFKRSCKKSLERDFKREGWVKSGHGAVDLILTVQHHE